MIVHKWIADLKAAVLDQGLPWTEPYVPVIPNAKGEFQIEWWSAGRTLDEWWSAGRTLDVFISAETEQVRVKVDYHTSFVRSWGTGVVTEMDDGLLTSIEHAVVLWRWLHNLSDLEALALSSGKDPAK